jgi:hypothetical protein
MQMILINIHYRSSHKRKDVKYAQNFIDSTPRHLSLCDATICVLYWAEVGTNIVMVECTYSCAQFANKG